MEKILHIRWYSGYMDIRMNAFFPCSQKKWKELLKIVRMDNNAYERMEDIIDFFRAQAVEREQDWKTESKLFWQYHQKEVDLKTLVETRKFPNGLPLNAEQVKQAKADLKETTAQKRERERWAKQAKKDKEWFEKMAAEGWVDYGR